MEHLHEKKGGGKNVDGWCEDRFGIPSYFRFFVEKYQPPSYYPGAMTVTSKLLRGPAAGRCTREEAAAAHQRQQAEARTAGSSTAIQQAKTQ